MLAFESRASALLAATAAGLGHDSYSELARLGTGSGNVTGTGMAAQFANMYARQDCSDFPVSSMTRILLEHGNSSALPPALKSQIVAALEGWEYWIDEVRPRVCFERSRACV